ncbi:hypothetical protein IFR05_014995 [Cadophora sp. M221]|nr:hypothetical protein IFR05_014995 [Cadophora sp. M221]
MTIVPVAEIPTVSLLYHLKKLVPATSENETDAPEPSQSFNDRIGLIRGDITKLQVGAIVNAANNSLLGGGGVDGAIHRAAGPGLLKECRKLDGCDTGSAKITDAYELPCKKVIHAVGPVYSSRFAEECAEDLAGCYTTSLKLAVANDCKSIAFSALSTGVYGYPSSDAASVAIKAVKDFLEGTDGDKLEKVIFCTFVPKDVDAYNNWLPRFFPSTEEPEIDDWEEVEAGETAENGPVSKEEAKVTLPDVPTAEPTEDGPAAKKPKPNDGDGEKA